MFKSTAIHDRISRVEDNINDVLEERFGRIEKLLETLLQQVELLKQHNKSVEDIVTQTSLENRVLKTNSENRVSEMQKAMNLILNDANLS